MTPKKTRHPTFMTPADSRSIQARIKLLSARLAHNHGRQRVVLGGGGVLAIASRDTRVVEGKVWDSKIAYFQPYSRFQRVSFNSPEIRSGLSSTFWCQLNQNCRLIGPSRPLSTPDRKCFLENRGLSDRPSRRMSASPLGRFKGHNSLLGPDHQTTLDSR